MVAFEEINHSSNSYALAIDQNVSGTLSPTDTFIESIIQWCVKLCGEQELIEAKDEFFETTGKVFYDDEMYHTRMHYFTCFFVFERPLKKRLNGLERATPFEAFLKEENNPVVGGYTHSLFKVLKTLNQGLILLNVITQEKLKIQKQNCETLKGINKGDYFQGFVLHLSNFSVLSRGLIFHSPKASTAIIQKIKAVKKKEGGWTPLDTVTSLARLQLKHHRLRHVDPNRLYLE